MAEGKETLDRLREQARQLAFHTSKLIDTKQN
jgi:hypothetical protein